MDKKIRVSGDFHKCLAGVDFQNNQTGLDKQSFMLLTGGIPRFLNAAMEGGFLPVTVRCRSFP
jgi:hypothetical protein